MENGMKPNDSSEHGESSVGYSLGGVKLSAASGANPDIAPGTLIGDFLIISRIGPGGCGVVYKALQKSVSREVALKLIKPGLSVQEVVERFEVEKATLGGLAHPNIVNVITGGKTSVELGGQPYFAMEYVEGFSITKFADKKNSTVHDRLKLFLQVCKAIEYAHDHDVIHRDIKPGNILVTEKAGREPLVKVIDFGIAKAVNNGLPVAYATQVGQPIGTPAYMSPEQTGLDPALVDEASDIYALGVLLYELLVGKLPLELRGELNEKIKTIRESKPQSPSARINEKDDATFFQVARKRGVDPSQLEKILKGELDRIVMKCLEKHPEQRYETVNSLVAAIDRYLKAEPPPSPPSPPPAKPEPPTHTTNIPLVYLVVVCLLVIAIVVVTIYLTRFPNQTAKGSAATQPAIASQPLAIDDISTPDGIMIITFNKLKAGSGQ